MSILVFLEHHGGELQKGSLAVLSKAATLGGDVAGVIVGSGLDGIADQAAAFGAATVYVADDRSSMRPCRSRASTRSRTSSTTRASRPVSSRESILAADITAGLAARLNAGLDLAVDDIANDGGSLVQQPSAFADFVVVDVGAGGTTPRMRGYFPRRRVRPHRARGGKVEVRSRRELPRRLARRPIVERGAAPRRAQPFDRRGRRTSSSPAASGLGRPEEFPRLVEELTKRSAARITATRAVVDAGWYPSRRRSARPASRSRRRSTHRRRHLRRDPAQGRDAELDDRRDQQGSTRRSSSSPISASSATCTRSSRSRD